MRKRIRKNIKETLSALVYCIQLSWKASPIYTLGRVLCNVATPAIVILNSFLGKYIINLFVGMYQGEGKRNFLVWLVLMILLLNIAMRICNLTEQYMKTMHDDILRNKIVSKLMVHSMQVDLECFDNIDYYDKLRATLRDIYSIMQILWSGLTFFSSLISFLIIFLIICCTNPVWVAVLVVVAIPSVVVATRYTKAFYNLSMEKMNAERRKSYLQGLAMDKRYAQDIRAYNVTDFFIAKYQELWKGIFNKEKSINQKRTVTNIIFNCLPEVVSMLICIDIGFQIFEGTLTVGDYSLYTGLISQFFNAATAISLAFSEIYDNKLRIMNLMKVLSYEKKILDSGEENLYDVQNIEFENVSFSYPNAKERTLKNISFSISKEQKTVFVGLNGSGKSTLIKLLLRMYDPTEGTIKINGRNIKEYKLDSIRESFSVYLQNMENYAMSLRDNIAMSDIDNRDNDEDMVKTLQEAGCEDFLNKSNKGLESELTHLFSEDGIELSGGQNQKLAIARTIFKKGSALILDEPSSNLDPETEHQIFQVLERYSKDKLTIFTSHRLNNVMLADRIIVLEGGRIIEDGSQIQLLKNNQRYAELFRYQQSKYEVAE